METLGIKSKTQIKTWMRWYKNGEPHHFSQHVGKQYVWGKEYRNLREVEQLKIQNRQLEAQLEILKKYKELERRWCQK
jgi:transposase